MWKNRGPVEGNCLLTGQGYRPIDPDRHDITMLRNPSGEMVLMDDIEIYLPQLGQFEISDAEEEELDSDVDHDTEEEDEEDEAK
ncbi:hypothetical protein ACH5RR_007190 [Cinchona calisaya]|uniref:Uncharacterized protein n=1 Tax=Cinchona calisaya TaxID=153742 RepID=A0ABD3AR33_9GENT